MPIEIQINAVTTLENGVKLFLVNADKVPAPGDFLSELELEKYRSLKIEKRRGDWLGGRYAAKTLLGGEAADGKTLRNIEITCDAWGRPEWSGKLLSITHSGPFRAAARGPGGIRFLGLDIEKAEPRDPAWYSDYFHKSELPEPDMDRAAALWTQKEAFLKALGLGLKADPLDIDLSGERPAFSRAALARYTEMGRPSFKTAVFRPAPGYLLSLAWQNC